MSDLSDRSAEKNELDAAPIIYNHLVVDRLGLTFAALSDPTRRSIVKRLTTGPATVNELARPFSISQQAISKHLAYLETARLIERRWRGRQNFCALRPDAIRDVADWAEGYREFWEKSFQRLDALLEDLQQANKPGHHPSLRSKRKPKK